MMDLGEDVEDVEVSEIFEVSTMLATAKRFAIQPSTLLALAVEWPALLTRESGEDAQTIMSPRTSPCDCEQVMDDDSRPTARLGRISQIRDLPEYAPKLGFSLQLDVSTR